MCRYFQYVKVPPGIRQMSAALMTCILKKSFLITKSYTHYLALSQLVFDKRVKVNMCVRTDVFLDLMIWCSTLINE